jgi:hypothetical protein
MKNFIQLYVNGLGVAMFSPLNNKRHEPSGHGRYGVPTECFGRQKAPKRDIRGDDQASAV